MGRHQLKDRTDGQPILIRSNSSGKMTLSIFNISCKKCVRKFVIYALIALLVLAITRMSSTPSAQLDQRPRQLQEQAAPLQPDASRAAAAATTRRSSNVNKKLGEWMILQHDVLACVHR